MYKMLSLLFISMLVFTGCQDDSSILGPTNNYSIDELSKGRPIFNYDLNLTNDTNLSDDLDSLETTKKLNGPILSKKNDSNSSPNRGLSLDYKTKVSETLTINGDSGGVVYLSYSWKSSESKKSEFSAKLDIPIGAFKGELTFEIIFDLNNYAVELYPSPYKFKKPVLLDLIYRNVDLTGFDPNSFIFDYLDGESEQIAYKSINIDLRKNTIEIIGAELSHFSRYGWTRSRSKK